jgi:cyclopropane fatty-acyl-phospholipid synthase-like methyltransferase
MNYNEIIERIDSNSHMVSMVPVDKIIEMGYILKFNENTRILDLCCGYGEMLKILGQVYKINGKGIDIAKEFVEEGNKRLFESALSNNIILECNDIMKCNETSYDVVICTEPYIFGNVENAIEILEKYIKPNGKIVIGTLVSIEKDIPQELIDFDGDNLHTEYELYETFLKNNYAISYIGRSTQGEWDKYFAWSSKRIINDYQSSKTNEEKRKQKEWLNKWHTMYSKYRIKYEQWCLYAIEKI